MADVSLEFSLTSAQAGIYMSAFFLGYVITQVPGGILADRSNPRNILVLTALVGGASTAVMGSIPGFGAGIAYRFITGLASGFVLSCSSKVVAQNFDAKERGVALGILMASPPLGITIASLLGPVLKNAIGWRNTFLVVGLLAVPVAVLLWLFAWRYTRACAAGVASDQGKSETFFLDTLRSFNSSRSQWRSWRRFMFMFTTTGFPHG